MQHHEFRFWAGTDESFSAYLAAAKAAENLDPKLAYHGDDEERPPRLLSRQGDIGVITIAGPLVPGDSWINKYVGITGYGEIREALVAAAQDHSINAILLDVSSGGGAVSGVHDIAELVASIDASAKPIHTFSDSIICSAAYWVGSGARRIDIGKIAEGGSIGTMQVHREVTKAMDAAGVTAKVFRSGKYKALGHSMEKLSQLAEETIQEQLDYMDNVFITHVSARRGMTVEKARSQIGEGRVFIGDAAVAVGLVDGVANFDEVISRIQGEIDSQKQRSQYGANFLKGPVVKSALTAQQIAAMAEGAGATSASGTAATPNQADIDAAAAEAEAAAAAAAASAASATPAPSQADKPNEVVAFLQGQLASAQAQNVDLTVKLRDLQTSAELAAGHMAAMRAIVEASVDRLQVALGGTQGDAAGLSEEVLLAKHASLRADFEKKFKAGGVAAVSSSGSSEKSVEQMSPNRLRRVQATRPSK